MHWPIAMVPMMLFLLGLVVLLALAWPLARLLAQMCIEVDTSTQSCSRHTLFAALQRFDARLLHWFGLTDVSAHSAADYFGAIVLFGTLGMVVSTVMLRCHGFFWGAPAGSQALPWPLALNIAIGFVTNTNWQAYNPELLSPWATHFALTTQQFFSAAVGLAVGLCFIRGLTQTPQRAKQTNHFWVDCVRLHAYVLLPCSGLLAIASVLLGTVQTLQPYIDVGSGKLITAGPVSTHTAIELLGGNGGGMFAANTAHPLVSPTLWVGILHIFAMLWLPAAMLLAYGIASEAWAHTRALALVMLGLLGLGALVVLTQELEISAPASHFNLQPSCHIAGKDLRIGCALSALEVEVATATSTGATIADLGHLQPTSLLVLLLNMLLGEVIFGGVGTGLVGMLLYVLLTVFLVGLLCGRTPEYFGKKVEKEQMVFVTLALLVGPLLIVIGTTYACCSDVLRGSLPAQGAMGLLTMMYAITSTVMNNGSMIGDAGFASDAWLQLTSVLMLLGRYANMYPVLKIAESMRSKKTTPTSVENGFPLQGKLFVSILASVLLGMGLLTFLPLLFLGPLLLMVQAG